MYWDDPSIAGFAKQAGWFGNDLDIAIAVALATSGNDDAFEYVPPFNLPGHEVGLWGVDVQTFHSYDVASMRNPVANAQAAHDLWLFFGRAWGLFPAFNSGAYRRFAFRAVAAAQAPSATQYGFALAGGDLDSRGLIGQTIDGHRAVDGLATVVRGI